MDDNFQADSDGGALRGLIAHGSDLTKPIYIDFQIAVPDEVAANGMAAVAGNLGYKVATYASPKCSIPWTCECSTRMVATYEAVRAVQTELAQLAAAFGGHPDGWGSFGNKPGGQPPVR